VLIFEGDSVQQYLQQLTVSHQRCKSMVHQLKSQKKGKEKTLNLETESKNLEQMQQTDLRGQTTTGS